MIRTQVYLEDDQSKLIDIVSAKSKRTKAEIIREAIGIGLDSMNKNHSGTVNGLLALADLGKKLNIQAPADLSTRIDDYLYGDEK